MDLRVILCESHASKPMGRLDYNGIMASQTIRVEQRLCYVYQVSENIGGPYAKTRGNRLLDRWYSPDRGYKRARLPPYNKKLS